jgi:hypothetical protein
MPVVEPAPASRSLASADLFAMQPDDVFGALPAALGCRQRVVEVAIVLVEIAALMRGEPSSQVSSMPSLWARARTGP